jgi:imidazolonepropionase-like amidohydrolase
MPHPQTFELTDGEALDAKLIGLEPGQAMTEVRGGTVLDGLGGRMEHATIVIRGDRIVAVRPASSERNDDPRPARVVDASGMTVMPGMVDAHIHFLGHTTTDPYRAHFTPSEGVKFVRAAFELYQALAYGFTTVRGLGHGQAEHIYALRQAKLEALIRGPRVLTSGWALSQTRGHGDVPELPWDWVEHERPRSAFCDGELECRIAARRNFGEGADLIKVYTSDNRTGRPDFTVDELAAIADEAHRRGRKVATHAKEYEGVRNALLAGIDTIEHGPARVHHDLIGMMLERGAYLVPTLATVHRVATEGAAWDAAPTAIERARYELDGRREFVHAAHAAGVKIATGSDAAVRAGFGLLAARELALLVECGLSPMQAVVAATSDAHQALGLAEDVGSLEPGKLAELVVVDGDPLDDISLLQDPRRIHNVLQVRDPLTF